MPSKRRRMVEPRKVREAEMVEADVKSADAEVSRRKRSLRG